MFVTHGVSLVGEVSKCEAWLEFKADIPITNSKAHRIPDKNDSYHCLSTEVSIRIDNNS